MATTTLNLASSLFLASYSSNYALAQAGDGVVVAAYPWIGQYFSGTYELSQIMAAFDVGTLPGGFVSAALTLTIDESYGNTTVEVRQHDWAADITAWVPGAALASKPLLGSIQVAPGGKRDITIPLSAFALTAPLKIVLSIADQRNNVTPTGDTTLLVSNARLAVTTEPARRASRTFIWL